MLASLSASAFRQLPFMGVIRVNVEAMEHGFAMGHPDWSNLGQGQPEVGPMEGAPPRMEHAPFQPEDHAYGAIEGIPEMREAVAAHYNRLYRKGKSSQYTAENVAMAPGGRAALTRIGAALDNVRLGYFTPDYTAYEDLLTTFPRIDPVWIELSASDGWVLDPDYLELRVVADGLGAVLISNPCNPTGAVIHGERLSRLVSLAREKGITLLMDEFYSHYFYGADHSVSAAEFVDDVNDDPVVICDGLTKSFRYPGWRVGWVVAPKSVIRNLAAAGSFLDGGPCRPIQRAAIEVLKPERADQETRALRKVFKDKQRLVLESLRSFGVRFEKEPEGTFYAFGYVGDLRPPFNDGQGFMRAAFAQKVLTVPGEFFDVNPNRLRPGPSPLAPYVRFSFGPPREVVQRGLEGLGRMLG
jgi:aspartate/methionine/tyrosine aminotransferase